MIRCEFPILKFHPFRNVCEKGAIYLYVLKMSYIHAQISKWKFVQQISMLILSVIAGFVKISHFFGLSVPFWISSYETNFINKPFVCIQSKSSVIFFFSFGFCFKPKSLRPSNHLHTQDVIIAKSLMITSIALCNKADGHSFVLAVINLNTLRNSRNSYNYIIWIVLI